jgi:uncharacterized repeat protein (TIGR01451 family)
MIPHLTTASRQRNKAFQNTHDTKSNKRVPVSTALLILLLLIIVAVGALITTPSSSAASAKKTSSASAPLASPSVALADVAGRIWWDGSKSGGLVRVHLPGLALLSSAPEPLEALLFQTAPAPETVNTFAAGCTTAQSSWNLGETICVQVSGEPVGTGGVVLRRVQLVTPAGFVFGSIDVTSSSQSFNFDLPADRTETFSDEIVDNRGTWRINVIDTTDATVVAVAAITVHDPDQVVADLQISKTPLGAEVNAGSNVSYQIFITNQGPDAAANVHFSDNTLPNTTFVSFTPEPGSGFTCTPPTVGSAGTTNCTKPNMAAGERASFIAVYLVSGSVGNNAELTDTTSVASNTFDPAGGSNDSTTTTTASNSTPPTCTLACPSNIMATADTVEDVDGLPTSGAHVSFPAAGTTGTCGAVTSTIPSGSFFPIGSTPVTINAVGGGSCSFIVTVTSSGSPVTIACPTSVTVNADSNCQAAVILGTPTTTGDGVTVTSSRSDGKPLTDPYPSGITIVSWTAANSSGTESCNQTITVNDITPPTITIATPAPVSADANCQAVVPDLTGEAHVVDNCGCDSSDSADACIGRVPITVTQDPAPGTLVGIGPHTITLTANDGSSNNDGAGNTATITTTFTVNDTTPPTFSFVPPSVTAYTGAGASACETVVSNATLGTATAADSCGTATVTRSPSVNTFSAGTTTVTWTATDGAGNMATATQSVTVVDNTAPTVSAPADLTLQCASEIPAASSSQATASDNCATPTVTVSDSSNGGAGTTASPLVITRTFTATDAAGNSASDAQIITVKDTTPPVLNAPNIVVSNDAGSCSAAVSFTGLSATDNCGGTANITTSVPSGTTFPKGTTTVTATATDAAGNTTSKSFTVTVNDTEAPSINYPASVVVNLPLNSTATSMPVTYTVTAADNCPGVTLSVNPTSGSVFPVGTTTVTATATDAAGNTTTRQFNVTVRYNFTGFFSPVGNLPTLNQVNAGRAIPVKFSLSGNKGLGIFAVDYPVSQQIACDSGAPVSDVTETVTAGSSSLSYSPDQYNYVWKTESSWAGTCRQLIVKLNDGTEHIAKFKFK